MGIWLVQRYPDLFHAYVSSGQMVNTTANDIMGYEFALKYLTEKGDLGSVEQLRRNGPPPYEGNGSFWTYAAYLNALNGYMYSHAAGEGGGHNQLFDALLASEYGLIDKFNWVRGLNDVFSAFYPRLSDLDFTTQATTLNVPVYFVVGRWDVNAMASLAEGYFEMLDAPHKRLIWFDVSGHTPLYEEPVHFVDVMVNTVLSNTTALKPAAVE